ncbi:MAG TPA: AAA family ATPase [Microlunatus sp.]|nr:AAA family ATPase [Microlunatus sp.]
MLVGRERERRRLDALLAGARLGQSGVLVISGEAGIGKTTLLDDVRGRTSDMRLLGVTGTEGERDLPFAGLAQLVRLTEVDLSELPGPQAEALGIALAIRKGRNADRFAVGAGLLSLLTARSEDRPICLLIDDAHLIDRPTQDALLFAARRLLADAVCMIIACRAGEPCRLADSALPALVLLGIDAAATREILRAEDRPFSPRLVERVVELSLGNPLAIRELAADPSALTDRPAGFPQRLPDTLSEVYARRAADLQPDVLLAARCAAVAGEDLAVVTRTCRNVGITVSSLDQAVDAGLVVVDGARVKFRHPLIRSAFYATAPPAIRRQLHAAVAEALEGEADRRLWHLSEATLGPDEAVAAGMEQVADRAAGRAAYAVAATAADRAAALSPRAADRARRLSSAATWAWRGGEIERARGLLADALQLGPGREVASRALHLWGVIAARSGAIDEARDVLLEAATDAADPVNALASLAEAVNCCFYLGDVATAVEIAATIVPELERASDVRARARGSIAAGCARILAGLDGSELIKAGLRFVAERPEHDPDLASWTVVGALFLRDSRTGRALLDAVVADRRAHSAVGELPHLLFHVARDRAAGDRWDRAAADYGEAIGLARELGQRTELAASLAGLAWLEARQGRAVARVHAEEALELCRPSSIHVMEIWAQLALADLAYGDGEVAAAAGAYQGVADRLDELGLRDVDLSPEPELVECRLRLGQPAGAGELATRYAHRAEAKGQPWALARAARLAALLAVDADLDERFGRALALHAATLDVFETARTQLLYGSRLRRARRRVDARQVLASALETFVGLGAEPWARAAADELAATGATVVRPDEDPTSRLTARELQIAVLLSEGRTTREAAGALFVSPKTVEYHLRNIYAKLGIASRSELAGHLARR